jgi:hypothetical protein
MGQKKRIKMEEIMPKLREVLPQPCSPWGVYVGKFY